MDSILAVQFVYGGGINWTIGSRLLLFSLGKRDLVYNWLNAFRFVDLFRKLADDLRAHEVTQEFHDLFHDQVSKKCWQPSLFSTCI